MGKLFLCVLLSCSPAGLQSKMARQWTDSTGNYAFEADLIGTSDDTVVLQRTNKDKDLVAMPIDKLSKADQERESFKLQAAAQAYQRDRQINQQMKMMELELLATAAGATDLWEVQLFPGRGVAGYPRVVVVPGKNSNDAKRIAMQRFPGYTAGSVAQANRP